MNISGSKSVFPICYCHCFIDTSLNDIKMNAPCEIKIPMLASHYFSFHNIIF